MTDRSKSGPTPKRDTKRRDAKREVDVVPLERTGKGPRRLAPFTRVRRTMARAAGEQVRKATGAPAKAGGSTQKGSAVGPPKPGRPIPPGGRVLPGDDVIPHARKGSDPEGRW